MDEKLMIEVFLLTDLHLDVVMPSLMTLGSLLIVLLTFNLIREPVLTSCYFNGDMICSNHQPMLRCNTFAVNHAQKCQEYSCYYYYRMREDETAV